MDAMLGKKYLWNDPCDYYRISVNILSPVSTLSNNIGGYSVCYEQCVSQKYSNVCIGIESSMMLNKWSVIINACFEM